MQSTCVSMIAFSPKTGATYVEKDCLVNLRARRTRDLHIMNISRMMDIYD